MSLLVFLMWPCPILLLTIGLGGLRLLLVGQEPSPPSPCPLSGRYLCGRWVVGASLSLRKPSIKRGASPPDSSLVLGLQLEIALAPIPVCPILRSWR